MKTLFVLTALAISLAANAQPKTLKTTKEAHALAEGMVKQIVAKQAKEAFELVKPYWPLEASEIDGLAATTQEQIPMLEESFGPITGYEFISSEQIGTTGYLESYMIKYEQSALRFYIIFYNGGNGWLVNALRWDDNWEFLFKTKLSSDND